MHLRNWSSFLIYFEWWPYKAEDALLRFSMAVNSFFSSAGNRVKSPTKRVATSRPPSASTASSSVAPSPAPVQTEAAKQQPQQPSQNQQPPKRQRPSKSKRWKKLAPFFDNIAVVRVGCLAFSGQLLSWFSGKKCIEFALHDPQRKTFSGINSLCYFGTFAF